MMKLKKTVILGSLVCLAIFAAAGSGGKKSASKGIKYAKQRLPLTAEPVNFNFEQSEPGEKQSDPRGISGSPPVIPHGIKDFLPIRWNENQCLDCHLKPEIGEGEPTAVPASHFIHFRAGGKKPAETIDESRYVCTLCHVSRSNAPPMIPVFNWVLK